jgi:hypothetical protein
MRYLLTISSSLTDRLMEVEHNNLMVEKKQMEEE